MIPTSVVNDESSDNEVFLYHLSGLIPQITRSSILIFDLSLTECRWKANVQVIQRWQRVCRTTSRCKRRSSQFMLTEGISICIERRWISRVRNGNCRYDRDRLFTSPEDVSTVSRVLEE